MVERRRVFVLLILSTHLINYATSQDAFLNLATKKIVAITSDKFLSLTLDPADLLTGDGFSSSTERSTNMAKALAPAYVRLAGPKSNSFTFERSLFLTNGKQNETSTFSEAHWVLVQQWAERSGLDVVSCLAPSRIEDEQTSNGWDSRNTLDLISFSDHMGYDLNWQLGYECQMRCEIDGIDLGKDVSRLRNILGSFPRYANSIIAGPDIIDFKTKDQQQYLQDYFNAAGNALSAVTWHPDFAGISLDSDGVALQVDNIETDKNMLYKALGKSIAKKQLWIAESKPEVCKKQFLGALVWARRLGSAARIGAQVIMRKPDTSNLFQPTPDYWVSLLHKMLVGREVLDTKFMAGNKSHVHFYCQCTKPSAKYDKGAITIFGLNLSPNKISVALKGLRIKAMHKYILMPGYDTPNRMFAETVLLNNEPLNLTEGKTIPEINPAVMVMGKNIAIKLPSGGIGFWVIPAARMKLCMGHESEIDKNLLMKLTKKLDDQEQDENVGQEIEEEEESELEEGEDIKNLLKSKKSKKKKHENEDDERKSKKIDAKRELEKLEKLLKRFGISEDKRGTNHKTDIESSEEDDDVGLVRFKNVSDSEEEIRAKLEEYRRRLAEHESKKRMYEDKKTKSTHDIEKQQHEQRWNFFIKEYNSQENTAVGSPIEESQREEETVPSQVKYDKEVPLRRKRDLEKFRGDDILGLKREGLFKKRISKDEAKERRLERRLKKKDKEEGLFKKDGPVGLYGPKVGIDSGENNFFGFPKMKPAENFPQGDVFLGSGTSSEERNDDYDYVQEDDDEETARKQKARELKRKMNELQHQDNTWVEDPDSHYLHMPKEFFESARIPSAVIKKDLQGHNELWEPEALQNLRDDTDESQKQDTDVIMSEAPHHEDEDKRTKESTMQKLTSYFGDSDIIKPKSNLGYDPSKPRANKKQGDFLGTEKPRVESTMNANQFRVQRLKTALDQDTYESTEPGSTQFVNSNPEEYSAESYDREEDLDRTRSQKKSKRQIADAEHIFDEEMINEDADINDNLKRRVIRKPDQDAPARPLESDQRAENQKATSVASTSGQAEVQVPAQTHSDVPLTQNPEEVPSKLPTEQIAVLSGAKIQDSGSNPSVPSIIPDGESSHLNSPILGSALPGPQKEPSSSSAGTDVIPTNVPGSDSNLQKDAEAHPVLDKDSLDPNSPNAHSALPTPEESSTPSNGNDHPSSIPNPENNATTEKKTDDGVPKNPTPNAETPSDVIVGSKSDVKTDKTQSTSTSSNNSNTKSATKLDSSPRNVPKSTAETPKVKNTIKLEVSKSSENSSKLQLADNVKELQKKREEKLSVLKEKLKTRKTKILQQYRQELVDALNKCDDEVEKTLKRRQVWDKFSEREEDLQDFADPEKLTYLMTNKPVNHYETVDEPSEIDRELRRYYSDLTMVQPEHDPRPAKVNPPVSITLYNGDDVTQLDPNVRHQRFEVTHRSREDPTSAEGPDGNRDSYYAIVENIDRPRILRKKDVRNWYAAKNHYSVDDSVNQEELEHRPDRIVTREAYQAPVDPERPGYRILSASELKRLGNIEDVDDSLEEDSVMGRLYRVKTSYYKGGRPAATSFDEGKPLSVARSYDGSYPDERIGYEYWGPSQRNRLRGVEPIRVTEYPRSTLYHKLREETKSDDEMADRAELPEPDRVTLDEMEEKVESGDEAAEEARNTSEQTSMSEPMELRRPRRARQFYQYLEGEMDQVDPEVRLFWHPSGSSGVRRSRDARTQKRNYIYVKGDSREVSSDNENVLKIVKSDEGYEAVPVLEDAMPSDLLSEVDVRRPSRTYEEYGVYRDRKNRDFEIEDRVDPYRKFVQKKHDLDKVSSEKRQRYYAIESGDESSSDEQGYELLMVIPVKRHGTSSRRRRNIETEDRSKNEIKREGSGEAVSQLWRDVVMETDGEKQLRDLVSERKKVMDDFEAEQRVIKEDIDKIIAIKDPALKKEFEREILNLQLINQIPTSSESRDELEKYQLGEHLKYQILEMIHDVNEQYEKEVDDPKEEPSLVEKIVPELEETVERKLENVKELAESFEDFIDEFEESENRNNGTLTDAEADGEHKSSLTFLNKVIHNVQRFFDFLVGITHVLHGY